MAAEVSANASSFETGTIHPLFETRAYGMLGPYDVMPDGQRFVIATSGEQPTAAITLVVNWPAELRNK